MKSGTCPKCHSSEVYCGSNVPLKAGPFGSNAVPIHLASIAALDNYVCIACGYVERYIDQANKLEEIGRRWDKVNSDEASAPGA